MTGALQLRDDGPPTAKCVGCGVEAVGPCARCHDPLCGDCCVITEGAKKWAICPACAEDGGRSLASGWISVILWVCAPIALLLVLLWLFASLAG